MGESATASFRDSARLKAITTSSISALGRCLCFGLVDVDSLGGCEVQAMELLLQMWKA